MTDVMHLSEDDTTAASGVQRQQTGYGGCEIRTASETDAGTRLLDAVSLPMVQYFQQPRRQFDRMA